MCIFLPHSQCLNGKDPVFTAAFIDCCVSLMNDFGLCNRRRFYLSICLLQPLICSALNHESTGFHVFHGDDSRHLNIREDALLRPCEDLVHVLESAILDCFSALPKLLYLINWTLGMVHRTFGFLHATKSPTDFSSRRLESGGCIVNLFMGAVARLLRDMHESVDEFHRLNDRDGVDEMHRSLLCVEWTVDNVKFGDGAIDDRLLQNVTNIGDVARRMILLFESLHRPSDDFYLQFYKSCVQCKTINYQGKDSSSLIPTDMAAADFPSSIFCSLITCLMGGDAVPSN